MKIVSKKIRASAKGEDCTFNMPCCNSNPETTVFCHIDSEEKGMGIKSPDVMGAYGCSDCHTHLDEGRLSDVDYSYYVMRAWLRTFFKLIEKGLVTYK